MATLGSDSAQGARTWGVPFLGPLRPLLLHPAGHLSLLCQDRATLGQLGHNGRSCTLSARISLHWSATSTRHMATTRQLPTSARTQNSVTTWPQQTGSASCCTSGDKKSPAVSIWVTQVCQENVMTGTSPAHGPEGPVATAVEGSPAGEPRPAGHAAHRGGPLQTGARRAPRPTRPSTRLRGSGPWLPVPSGPSAPRR